MFHFKNKENNDLFQWDTNIYIEFDTDDTVTEVHFSNDGKSTYVCSVVDNCVMIPNELLQQPRPLIIYIIKLNGESVYTKERYIFKVLPRPMPSDYTYEPSTLPSLAQKVDIYQGEDNANKVMAVGEDGQLYASELSSLIRLYSLTLNGGKA
jgi:hypothetical protein